MKPRRVPQWFMVASLAIGLLTLSVPVAGAQSGGAYALTWNTIDGGGGSSAGGVYSIDGTIGQPDAGGSNGGNYSLVGGFWFGGQSIVPQDVLRVFMPLVKR